VSARPEPGASVEQLACDVEVAGVPGRLLDHVQHDPAQVGGLSGDDRVRMYFPSFCYIREGVAMAKKLVDIDVAALEEARRILGVTTYKDTVNAGLREIIAAAARRREIERFLDPEPHDVEDPDIVATAWR
jgi:Arc/MetJ family transcription regulator